MFREFLGFDENEKPILGKPVMSVEELHKLKQEARDEMYARLEAGELTRHEHELQKEVSCMSEKWRANIKEILITEPNGETYSAEDLKKYNMKDKEKLTFTEVSEYLETIPSDETNKLVLVGGRL